ncbi:MAG: hypothetical protein AAFR87_26855 [Bacteroidota bacterium]
MKELLIIVSLLYASLTFVSGQSTYSATKADPRLYIKASTPNGDYMEINYDINAPGFVELHLFNPDKKKVWIKGRVSNKSGVDKIRIPKKGLKSNGRWAFVLKYKGKDYNGSFFIN